MVKKILTTVLVLALLLASIPFASFGAAPDQDEIEASNYFTAYGATLYSDGTTGKLKLWHEAYAKDTMNNIGVYKILVKKSNGTLVRTIWGSTANGLQATNNWYHYGTYTLSLTSGTTYYCVVTFVAGNSSGADTRTVTTTAVTCP